MALDEALFHWSSATGLAAARFYHWDTPAVTVGYFHRTAEQDLPLPAGAVRRYTGGGLVEHGADLTFVLTLPAGSDAALAAAAARYRWIHERLATALAGAGLMTVLEPPGLPRGGGPCFSDPVPWDLRDPRSGVKIGGGAQRRSRGAVIHQGSVRLPEALRDPGAEWIGDFLKGLARSRAPLDAVVRESVTADALDRESGRYGSAAWNRPWNSSGKRV
jgi:lipoyl(octanoyl) transferase